MNRAFGTFFATLGMAWLGTGCAAYVEENFFVEQRDARRRDCPPRVSAEAKPVPVWRVPPAYPKEAWENYVQGRVLIEFRISDEGRITSVKPIAEEPAGYFLEAAVRAMWDWEYCPILAGEPSYDQAYQVVFPFRLAKPADPIPLDPDDFELEPVSEPAREI